MIKTVYKKRYELVIIGASIGGPQALKTIFSVLPKDFPAPILVVQHMSLGFMDDFVKWLHEEILLPVKLAENGEPIKNGIIYFAPDNYHLTVINHQSSLSVRLVQGNAVSGFCPSITELFRSAAAVCGKKTLGALLTGMGSDGAQGCLILKQAGGHTIIQDAKSAVVFGMARVAESLDAVDKIVELEKIGNYLIEMTR